MIRIVHTLSGSGGTLLSRCLGALPGTALLSEINPLAVHLFPEFDPFYQDEHWLHLLTDEDKQRLSGLDLGVPAAFRELIGCLWERARSANKALILRDYNHVDFIGIPYIDNPPRRRVLYDALPEGVPNAAIAFVRHPIDQWTSICKHSGVGSNLPQGYFCDAYAAFLQDLRDTPIFRYEDFVSDPDGQLRNICRLLQIPFDPAFRQKFHDFSSVTGDFSRQAETAITLPRKAAVNAAVLNSFRSTPSFFRILRRLRYAEMPPSCAPGKESTIAHSLAPGGSEFPNEALEMALVSEGDRHLPADLNRVNLVMNRMRLARFLADFGEDRDVVDFLALDTWAAAAGIPVSSTGRLEATAELILRPFRLWEYTWLYKSLGLWRGALPSGEPLKVLDLGGPASHLTVLAAMAGCAVTSLDPNPEFVRAGRECAEAFNLSRFECFIGDMRDLSRFPDEAFDIVVSCSVLEHLTAADQEIAVREIARVLKAGGLAGFTFDYGPPAPGANEDLIPPHDPPQTCTAASARYSQGALVGVGVPLSEDPVPGSLFHNESVRYTIACLVQAKPPVPEVEIPACMPGPSRLLSAPAIPKLLFRLFRQVSSSPAAQRLIAAEAIAASRQAQLDSMAKHAAMQQAAAAERLAALQVNQEALDNLRAQLDLAAQHSATVQAAADERLAVLQKTHEAAAVLRAELEARQTEISELKRQLESARRAAPASPPIAK